MSAQAGIFYYDRRPIDPAVPGRLLPSIAEFGPDGGGAFTANGLVMVSRLLHVNYRDRLDYQPYESARGNVITWDGRLDNRGDLIAQFWRDLEGEPSDAALALRVYERWGVSGFSKLIGDWSLVIFDSSEDALVLSSDYLGIRGLHYAEFPDRLEWSTSLGSLVDRLDCVDDLEPRYVAGYLALALQPTVTPYRLIRSVPAANALIHRRTRHHTRHRYWHYLTKEIRCTDVESYAEDFRLLFTEGVAARMPELGPTFAELSGGLDSSAVVSVVDFLRRGGRIPESFHTVSYVSNESPDSDESRFIAIVETHARTQAHRVNADEHGSDCDIAHAWIVPMFPSGIGLAIRDLVRNSGGRVLLTGHAGDEVSGNRLRGPDHIAARLSSLAFLRALHKAREWSRASKLTLLTTLNVALTSFLPHQMQVDRELRHRLYIMGARQLRNIGAAIADVFLLSPQWTHIWLEEITRQTMALAEWPSVSTRTLAESFHGMADRRALETSPDYPGLLITHPFTHRPLTDLIFSLPPDVLYDAGAPRALMRRALAGYMPDRIVKRFSKGHADPLILRRLRQLVPRHRTHVADLEVVKRGYIDPVRLSLALDAMCDGSLRYTRNLSVIFQVEQWLANRSQHYQAYKNARMEGGDSNGVSAAGLGARRCRSHSGESDNDSDGHRQLGVAVSQARWVDRWPRRVGP